MALPFAPTRHDAPSGRAIDHTPAKPPIRILVVDDEEDQFVLVRRLLAPFTSPGFEVEWADGHATGMVALERRPFDVCLVDYRLGLTDGVRFIREAKIIRADVPFILVTGRGDRAVDVHAMGAGAIDYLSKGSLEGAGLERAIRYATTQQALVSAVRRESERTLALDEVSQVLTLDGPSSKGLDVVLGVIDSRLGHTRAAVYLLAGDQLTLGGARGFTHPIPSLAAANGPLGRVLAHGRASIGPSWTESSKDPNGQLVIPMAFESRTVGLLTVVISDEQPLDAPDRAVLLEIAARVGSAIGLHQERKWLAEGRLLLRRAGEFTEAALGEPPGDGHLERILGRLRVAFSADGFALAKPEEGGLVVGSAIGSLHDRLGRAIDPAHSVAARARESRTVQVDSSGISCAAYVPVMAGSRWLGLLWVDRRGTGAQYSALETEALSLLGGVVGLALSVARDRAEATASGVRDKASGLYTRPFLDALLATYGAMKGSSDENVGLVLVAPGDPDTITAAENRRALDDFTAIARDHVSDGPDVASRYGPGSVAVLVRREASHRTAALASALAAVAQADGSVAIAVGWAVRSSEEAGSLEAAADMALELSRRTRTVVEA